MAEGDRQLAFTTGPLPVSVQVSGADKLTPKTVNASFDGTGAAGAFLPCLIITGRTGHEVARIPAPQVAAGASAEVSWFPRVGGASASASATAREVLQSNVATTILATNSDYLNWNHLAGSSLLDTTIPKAPTVKADGVYAVTVTVRPTPLPVGARYYVQLSGSGADNPYAVQASGASVAQDTQPWAACTLTLAMVTGQILRAYVYNYDSAPHNFVLAPAVVQKVS